MSEKKNWTEIIKQRLALQFSGEADKFEVLCVDESSGKFKVTIVSDQFKSKMPIARHRLVTKSVGLVSAPESEQELETAKGIHALEIEAKTLEE